LLDAANSSLPATGSRL